MTYKLNYPNLPILATAFTKGKDLFGWVINVFAPGPCGHALLITEDHGQKFATEEDNGLKENSLEEYTTDKNRIVAMYYWTGWDSIEKREAAETYLAEIRRRRAENSKYDWAGLLSFVPVLNHWFKPSPVRQWCSENVLSIHDRFGFKSNWFGRPPSPAQLEILMQSRKDVVCVLGYYIDGGHA
jgi:hypothetical protein